jgi:hypothetical protein
MAAAGQAARARVGRDIAAVTPRAPSGPGGAFAQLEDAVRAFDARIAALDSAGDTAHLRITPEVKAQGNLRLGKAGVKGQLGALITVTRDSDAPDTGYTVRYDKQSLGLVVGEVGTDKLGRGGKTGPAGGAVKAELGGLTSDAVEMSFASPEEAARAAGILQKLHLADTIGDGVDLGRLLLTPTLGPLAAQGASQVAANPVTETGAPGSTSAEIAGLEDTDIAFLRANITAHETTLGARARAALELKLKREGVVPAFETRLDGLQTVTRRVELATDSADGQLSYTLGGGLRLSAKERANRAAFGPLAAKLDNRLELAMTTTAITLDYAIPKGTDLTTASGDRPVPEYDAYEGRIDMPLDRVSVHNQTDLQTQTPLDPTRGDVLRLTEALTIEQPEQVGPAFEALFAGEFEDAASLAGANVTLTAQDIVRTGVDLQPGFKVDLGLAEAEGSLILAAGTDDIVREQTLAIAPGTPAPPPALATLEDDGLTFAVVPTIGASVREAAGGSRIGVAQTGSFLRDTGARDLDALGREWMKVTGTDLNDAAIEGWVLPKTLIAFNSGIGAMGETGRINPTAELNRMDKVVVEKKGTLWNIAKTNGWDFRETKAANPHLRDAALIFAGDTVYAPGSAKGPLPAPDATDGSVITTSRADPDAPPVSPARAAVSDGVESAPTVLDQAPTAPMAPPASPTLPGSPTADSAPALPAAPPSLSGPSYTATPPAPPTAPTPGTLPPDAELDRILATYQVKADPNSRPFQPKLQNGATESIAGGLAQAGEWVTGHEMTDALDAAIAELANREMPSIEVDALDQLGPIDQVRWMMTTQDTMKAAPYAYDPPPGISRFEMRWTNDGHVDAYRHILWNARLTMLFGSAWTKVYCTAHEKVPGNPAQREAMDLYNNALGRRIANQNPGASDMELQRLVRDAIARGDAVVLGEDLSLRWSDDVAIGENGVILGNTPVEELPGRDDVDIDADDLKTASG